MTHIWIGLCIYFLQRCIKKFSDRAPLVNFARQEPGCRATACAPVNSTSIAHSQLSSFRRLCADSWLLSLIARQPPLEKVKASSSYHQDHGVCVLSKILICLLSVVPEVKTTCIWVGKTTPMSRWTGQISISSNLKPFTQSSTWACLLAGLSAGLNHYGRRPAPTAASCLAISGHGQKSSGLFTSTCPCICS